MESFCTLLQAFQKISMQLAFFGTIVGLILFGIMKIWSIVSPESGNQARDYIKQLGIGILLVSGALAIAQGIFALIPGGEEAMSCF